MKFAVAGTIALLFTSGAAFGQNTQNTQATVLTSTPETSSCPIGMRARHAFSVQRQLAGDHRTPDDKGTTPVKDRAMALRLTLTPMDKRRIATAWVTIAGLSGKNAKFMPADASGQTGKLRRSMQIAFAPGDDGNVDAYFQAAGFTSIRSIQLKSVTYSDGTTWKLPTQNACSVVPDGFMLVAAN